MGQIEIVKFGLLGRLITGAGSLTLSENGILLGNRFLEFPKPLEELSFKCGLLVDKLIWGEKSYRFLKNKILRDKLSCLEDDRLRYWEPTYKVSFDKLVDTADKFVNYINSLNRYIRGSQKEDWVKRLSPSIELLSLRDEYKTLGFDDSKINNSLILFLADPDEFIADRNSAFVKNQLTVAKDLFDSLEEHPLTDRQCEACVYDEDNVLLIAGAGTGKTSTMVAKAAYLVKQGFAQPDEILMLAYGKDARQELEERVYGFDYLNGVVIRTFHSLGKEIIGFYEKRSTEVSVLASDDKQYIKFVDNQIKALMVKGSLNDTLMSLFSDYLHPQPNDLEFKSNGEYLEYVRDNEIRDFAGNLVKSYEELKISNYLFKNGIRFEYEREYPHPVSSPGRNVYKPDYYLPDLDVYIEHFGIDEKGNTRPGINKEKYNKEREWKISVHQENGTHLIQTFSYQSKQGLEEALKSELRKYCEANGLELDEFIKPITKGKLFSVLKELGAYKNFSRLVANFLALFKSSPFDIQHLPVPEGSQYNKTRIQLFHRIFNWVYEQYCSVLTANQTIDFADMIREAERIVRSKDFHDKTDSKYRFRYIMVDEFQDISPIRANLIEALKEVGANCALFCVGDDWQAIYRFTGSDISLTTNFPERFGKTYTSYLDKTFRFNDRIEAVASAFVQQNDKQLKKVLVTHAKSNKTEVNILRGESEKVLRDTLSNINSHAETGSTVLVLSRFKESIKNVGALKKTYENINIKQMSAHASKGKQADYVIILDVIDGKYGFPSKVTTDPLLESLLPTLEDYAYAEERRLFYVALTRARKTVFIHTVLGKESVFLKEMKEKGFDVQFDKNELSQLLIDSARCPECGVGTLIPRKGKYGLFFACGLGQNYCDTTVSRCPTCGQAPLLRNEEFHYCASSNCTFKTDCCPECFTGYLMVRKNTRTGQEFVGCSNFKGDEPGSCKFSKSVKSYKSRID